MTTRNEIIQELREVLLKRVPVIDAIVPPLTFIIVNGIAGLTAGAVLAVTSGIAIAMVRLLRKRPIRFAIAGMAGTVGAASLATWSGSAEAFFLPGIISGGLTALVALLSIVAGRPMVAWTSMLVRRWPAAWYWHPQVRPAYREVTWLWAAFFAGRAAWQWRLAQQGELAALAGLRTLGGWPALVLLLIVTYLYGTMRLARLGGPSVEEFRTKAPAPWIGQRRGF